MHRLLQDVRFALRTFVKTPAFTAIAIVVLALGIGANSAVFTIVNAMILKPLSGRAGELVGLYSHDPSVPGSYRAFSYPNYVDIREHGGVFDALMAHTFAMVGEPKGDTMRRTFVELVSSNYFDALGVSLAAGRTFTKDEERPGARIPVVIATYARWQRANLDPDFIGSTIRLNAEDFTVVGVAPDGFTGTMALVTAELYMPLGMFDTMVNDMFKTNGSGLADRANTTLILAGRVKPGQSPSQLDARLEALSRQMAEEYPAENKNQKLTVSPLSRMSTSTSPQTDGGLGMFSGFLLGLSGAVLVIACLNIANMLLARGASRRKEVAMRLALGANRSRIVMQLLTESVMLALAGATLGLLFSYWTMKGLKLSMAAALPLNVSFDPRPDTAVLAVTIGFAMLSTIVFGLGPAMKLTRRDLVRDLKDLGADGSIIGRRFGARNLMVIGQVALSLALLTAGGIFARAALGAAASDPGYSYDRLLLATLDPGLAAMSDDRGRAVYRSVLDRFRSLPNVQHVALASTLPFGDMHEGHRVERVGAAATDEEINARTYRIISADYFAAVGLKMLRGREFTRSEEESGTAPRVAIIDEMLARSLFKNEDPIGQLIRIHQTPGVRAGNVSFEPMQVVGIAPPLKDGLLDRGPQSHLYVPFGRNYRSNMHVHVKVAPGTDETATLTVMRDTIRATDPTLPVLALSTMQAFHDNGLELWALKAGGRLFTALGLLAALLAVVGVYGVKSYVVAQRTREIGIRMALGASPRDVLRLVLRDGAFLTAAGVALGVPLAAFISYAFTKVFVELGGFDPVVVGGSTALLVISATVASVVPARRAAHVAPLTALRTD